MTFGRWLEAAGLMGLYSPKPCGERAASGNAGSTRTGRAHQRGSRRPLKQRQWDAFRRRLLGSDAPATFAEVGTAVRTFMKPVAAAVASGEAFEREWPPGGPWRP